MDELVSSIEQVTLDSERPKNWGDLPMEMQLECIKHMDLRTKFRLQQTSKTEKSLVDSSKITLKSVLIIASRTFLGVEFGERDRVSSVSTESFGSLFVLKTCLWILNRTVSIGNLVYFHRQRGLYSCLLLAELKKRAPFQIRVSEMQILSVDDISTPICLFKLNSFDMVQVMVSRKSESHFLNVAKVFDEQFADCYMTPESDGDVLLAVVQLWIDTNALIGRIFEASCGKHAFARTIIKFLKKFDGRIVEKKAGLARIRTNNWSKHIVCKYEVSSLKCEIIASSEPLSQ